MFIKVCGITSLGDARHAIESGASALGFVIATRMTGRGARMVAGE